MAVSFPGDIVSAVVAKADPARRAEAEARLSSMSGTAPAGDTRFAEAVRSGREVSGPAAAPSDGKTETDNAPLQKFEALLLQQVFAAMMPEEQDALVDTGFAGDMWRSMQVEKMAESFAERGGIGLTQGMSAHYGASGRAQSERAADNTGAVAAGIVDQEMFRMLRRQDGSS